jgi:hypothetical protein
VTKARLYLETTIPSYPISRPSRDLVIAGHQQITGEWWEKRRERFQIYISQLVVDEAGAGDPGAARERMKVIQQFPLLDITPEVEVLPSRILASRALPQKAATDAAILPSQPYTAWICCQPGTVCISRTPSSPEPSPRSAAGMVASVRSSARPKNY